MSGSVMITQELAAAIENVKEAQDKGESWEGCPIKLLDRNVLRNAQGDWDAATTIYEYINSSIENTVNYYNAVTSGYDVELTVEQKVANYFKSLEVHPGDYHLETTQTKFAERDGIINTLNYLNIKIIGVNALDPDKH